MASNNKATAPAIAGGFDKALETTPTKEAGPSYKQLAYAFSLLVAATDFNEEQRKQLRTRTGVSALIEMLKPTHQATLDSDKAAATAATS